MAKGHGCSAWDRMACTQVGQVGEGRGVEAATHQKIDIEHGDGGAPQSPSPQEGDGEVCGVAQVLHERVHSPRDGLRNEAARDAVRLGECAENCSAKTDRPE